MDRLYLFTPEQCFSTACCVLLCGFALLRGGKPERIAAVLLLFDWLSTPLLQGHDAYRHAEMPIFLMDGVVSAALILIALSTNRYWPMWAAAFQILEVLMHVAMLIDHKVRPRAYFIGMEISSYLIIFALALGALFETGRQYRTVGSVIRS